MTTAHDDFNAALLEFIDQLVDVFPEVSELAVYNSMAPGLIKANPAMPSKMFLQATQDHAVKIVARDSSFFEDCPKILNIDIKSLWSKDLSNQSRNVIWSYIGHLYTLAFQGSLTPEARSQLESVAKDEEKMSKLQDIAQNMVSQMATAGLDVQQLLSGFMGPK